jgi:hypothetical protein
VCRLLHNDAGEAPGVPAGRRRLGHATALDAGLLLLPFQLRPLIHHASSRLHRGRPRPRQHADWLRHHYIVLLPISTRAPLKNGTAIRGSRLETATDVAGVLGWQRWAVRSHWREWRLTALNVGPGPAESAMGPMEKMPHRG